MWWYVLQIAVGGSVLLSDGAYHWSIGPYDAGLLALAAAYSTSFLLAGAIDVVRWLTGRSQPAVPEPMPSAGAGAASSVIGARLEPPRRAVRPKATGSGGLR